jgi:hypothetical protein
MPAHDAHQPVRSTRPRPRDSHPEIETALQIQFRSVESLLRTMENLSGRNVPRRPRRR